MNDNYDDVQIFNDGLGGEEYLDNGAFDAHAAAEDSLRQAEVEAEAGDDLVREYARKYHAEEPGDSDSSWVQRRKRAETLASEYVARGQWKPRSRRVAGLTDDDKLWSSVAHLSLLIATGLGMLTSSFPLSLLALLIPVGIYLAWRDRSEFISFNAKQSFAMVLAATLGFGALMTGGVLVLVLGIIISAIASIVLVGIPFLILFIVLLVVFVIAAPVIPFALLVLSGVAAYQTYTGHEFRYPYIADWVDRLSGGEHKVASL